MKLAEKYAPKTLNDVIYQNIALERRIKGYAEGYFDGHLILHGGNGSGKTSVANLLPFEISGKNANFEQKNCDDLLKIKDLSAHFRDSCHSAKLIYGSSKYYFVSHEFDSIKGDMAKLWNALDECNSDLMMIITTNNPMIIHQSIRSRCKLIEFPSLTAAEFLSRAKFILCTEGLLIPDSDVLMHLQSVENFRDIRKYMEKLEELLYMNKHGMAIPTGMPKAHKKPILSVASP